MSCSIDTLKSKIQKIIDSEGPMLIINPKEGRDAIISEIYKLRNDFGIINPTTIEDSFDKDLKESLEIFKEILDLGSLEPITIDTFKNILTRSDVALQAVEQAKTTEEVRGEKTEAAEIREQVLDDFVNRYFKNSPMAATIFNNRSREIAVTAFLYNNKQGDSWGYNLTPNSFNDSIRTAQKQLWNTVASYLKDAGITTTKLSFTRRNFNTIVELVKKGKFKAPNKSLSQIAYEVSRGEGNSNFLEAYNAWVLLENFDAFIDMTFGEAVIINENVDMFSNSSEFKYMLSDKGTGVINNHRTSDDIDIFKESNNIVKAIIESIPLVDINGVTVQGSYMGFQQYVYIVSKIKAAKAGRDGLINVSKLEELIKEVPLEYVKTSSKNQVPITLLNFSGLLAAARSNPSKIYPILFKLFSNKQFRDKFGDTFSNNDARYITSLYNKLFDKEGHSLVTAQTRANQKGVNFLSYIAQNMDSIHGTLYSQYRENSKGEIVYVGLKDHSLATLKASIEDTIQVNNSPSAIRGFYKGLSEKYDVKINLDGNGKPLGLRFVVGPWAFEYTSGKLNIDKGGNDYNSHLDKDGKIDKDLVEFIKDRLDIDVNLQSFRSYYPMTWGNNGSGPIGDLASLAGEVFSRVIVENGAQGAYAKDFNFDKHDKYNSLAYIPNLRVPVLENIAIAKAGMNNMLTASRVKDGDGNSVGNQGLSRIVDNYNNQFNRQNKTEQSASKDFSLFGILDRVEQAREAKIGEHYKKLVDMSAKEMAIASYHFDWNDAIETGELRLIPSVMSDKSFIGRLVINVGEDLKTLLGQAKNGDFSEINKQLINNIGLFYKNVEKNLSDDLDAIAKLAYPENEALQNLLGNNYTILKKALKGVFGSTSLDSLESRYVLLNRIFDEVIKDHLDNEDTFKAALAKYDVKDAASFYAALIKHHNHLNPNQRIKFAKEIHYVKQGNKLAINPTLQSLHYRFNDADALHEYFNLQEQELLKSLLDNDFSHPDETPLAVFTYKGISYDIISKAHLDLELIKLGISLENALNKGATLVLSDSLKLINRLDYLYSQQWTTATVGSHYAHASKVKGSFEGKNYTDNLIEYLKDENSRKNAQDKRNVAQTATMQQYHLGLRRGVPNEANVAIIESPHDNVYNVNGDLGEFDAVDGAMLTGAVMSRLENESLGGAKAGITKKPIFHGYDERTGAATLIKTAGFTLTNNVVRNSKRYQNILKNMYNIRWRDEHGNPIQELDITKGIPTGYNQTTGEFIQESMIDSYRDPSLANLAHNPIVAFENKQNSNFVVGITNMEYIGNNTYKLTMHTYSKTGKLVENSERVANFEANTVHEVYRMLGGMWSMSLVNGRFQYSEHSNAALTEAVVGVGYIKEGVLEDFKNGVAAEWADQVHQPLKEAMIHYVVMDSGVKVGSYNVNSRSWFDKTGTIDSPGLDYFKLSLTHAGIQLDKEHLADNSDVSLMTQVIAACADRGYTFNKANGVYKAIEALANVALAEFHQFAKTDPHNPEFRTKVVNIIVDAFSKERSSNSLQATLKEEFQKLIDHGADIKSGWAAKMMPISDSSLFNLALSKLSVNITKAAIRLRLDGSLNVLNPTFSFIKLHGDRRLEEWGANSNNLKAHQNSNASLIYTSDKEAKGFNDLALVHTKLRLNRPYIIKTADGKEHKITIKNPGRTQGSLLGYHTVLSSIVNGTHEGYNITEIREDFIEGRDLAHYNVVFEASNGKSYQLYDLVSIQNLYELTSQKSKLKDPDHLEEIKLARRQVQRDLAKLSKGQGDVAVLSFTPMTNGNYNLVETTVNILNRTVESAEVILPKMFKSKYLLEDGDYIADIKGSGFFLDRLKAKYVAKTDNFHVEFKVGNGSHIYIQKLANISSDSYQKSIHTFVDAEGQLWRVNRKGEKLHRLFSSEDRVFVHKGVEILVPHTDNYEDALKFYAQEFEYDTVNTLDPEVVILLSQIENKPEELEGWLKSLGNGDLKTTLLNRHNSFQSPGVPNGSEYLNKKFERNAQEMYSSFKHALQSIASRTPAQSMQSFMSQKIVGFDSSDTNSAYVATTQLWLQGSDFDIDAATFTTFATNKYGVFQHWSPLANLDTPDTLNYSRHLPFPTGVDVDIKDAPEVEFSTNIDDFIENGKLKKLTTEAEFKELSRIIESINTYGPNVIFSDNEDNKVAFLNAVNLHNTKLFAWGKSKQENALKNFMLTQIHEIISDPINQPGAQVPIDSATGIIKEAANDPNNPIASKSDNLNVGNSFSKIDAIHKNQVGKGGVAIGAVGIKVFMNLTHYNNAVINNPHSTLEDIKRLLFNGLEGKTIGGKTYYALTNIYKEGEEMYNDTPLEDQKKKIRELEKQLINDPGVEQNLKNAYIQFLISSNQDVSALTIIAALMSEAVDNAKSLTLGKINAGVDTLGTYIYGSMVGMDFRSIYDIMVSNPALIYSKLLNGNVFTKEADKNLGSILKYIQRGPSRDLNAIAIEYGNNVQKRSERDLIEAFWNELLRPNLVKGLNNISFNANSYATLLAEIATKDKDVVNEALRILAESFDANINDAGEDKELLRAYRKVILTSVSYLQNVSQMVGEENIQNFMNVVTLLVGAEESANIGRVLSINQGTKTSIVDLNNYYESLNFITTRNTQITNTEKLYERVGKRVNKPSEENEIKDFSKDMVYDDIDELAEKYEAYKNTFNVYDMLRNMPNVHAQVNAAILIDKEMEVSSAKYRTIKEWLPYMKARNSKERQHAIKGIGHGFDFTVANRFLEGRVNVVVTKEEMPLIYKFRDGNGGLISKLENREQRAAFKTWMEAVVLPNLKKGIYDVSNPNGIKSSHTLENNEFIKSLGFKLISNSPLKIDRINIATNINMAPRSKEEEMSLQRLKEAFAALDNTEYGMYIMPSLDGKTTNSYRLIDLFFMYNLIANLNARGERTLTSIFDGVKGVGVIKKYYDFIAELDSDPTKLVTQRTEDNTGDLTIEYRDMELFGGPISGVRNARHKGLVRMQGKLYKAYKVDPNEIGEGQKIYLTDYNSYVILRPVRVNRSSTGDRTLLRSDYELVVNNVNGLKYKDIFLEGADLSITLSGFRDYISKVKVLHPSLPNGEVFITIPKNIDQEVPSDINDPNSELKTIKVRDAIWRLQISQELTPEGAAINLTTDKLVIEALNTLMNNEQIPECGG